MFTKKKLHTRKKTNKPFINTLGIISVFGVFLLGLFALTQLGNSNFDVYKTLDTGGLFLSEQEKEKLKEIKREKEKIALKKKQDENKINILLIGRGGYGNDAPELTDSIIIASINKKENYISMLSIPRDLYIDYGDYSKSGVNITGKINGLYVHYLAKYNDEQEAMEELKEKLTQVTGEKIDHYVNIDFKGFVQLVDSIGGIDVVVPKTLIDYEYPDNNHGYQTFILREGEWLIDGEVALKYARSRKNTGGDFGRSERQQQIIQSIKDKLLNIGNIASPSKIKKIYTIFQNYLTTDIDIITALKIFKELEIDNHSITYSSGLNASCIKIDECERGGYLYYPQRIHFAGQSVLLGESADHNNLNSFEKITSYSDIVFNYPELFEEKYKISIFSSVKLKEKAREIQAELKKIGLEINMLEIIGKFPEEERLISQSGSQQEGNSPNERKLSNDQVDALLNKYSLKEESPNNAELKAKIIYNNILLEQESRSITYLKEYLQTTQVERTEFPKYAKDPKTKIEIILQ